ncbi:MAG: transporter [Bacteriovoracaceae bacterium]|nr:transporter [Bacteriovoracaceae bacterium]
MKKTQISWLKGIVKTVVFLCFSGESFSAYYDTLPRGVRMLALKQVQTSTIESAFDRQQQEQSYFFRLNLDASSIENVDETLKAAFQEVKAISPLAYEQLTFGEYQARGSADVKVDGAGLAFGLSNRLTIYGTFPWYDARVNLDIRRTRENNYQDVANTLKENGEGAAANILSQVTPGLPDINGGVVQSVVVNYLNYQPLGNWQAEGMGDMELGAIYRLTDWDNAGLALTGGVILPTGREDDPDILQDFAFGDGQTDVFLEFGGGINIPNSRWSFESFLRYTYQFSHDRIMRVPESSDYPYGSENGLFREKLGNMIDVTTNVNFQLKRWIGFSWGYLYNYIGIANYDSQFGVANDIHALYTERSQKTFRAGLHLSTVPLYKSGDFFLPFNCNITAQQIVDGMNTPKYARYDVEFRFYF